MARQVQRGTLSKPQEWVAAKSGPIEAVCHLDLDGRPGFKMGLKVVAGNWYLFLGHIWHGGISIVDVTSPAEPRLVRFLEVAPNTWSSQVTIHGDLMATNMELLHPSWGGDENAAFEEGVALWDISDPTNPQRRGTFRTGHMGTHRNSFDSQGLLHVSARVRGYRGGIYILVDVSNPDRPVEVGRFHMRDQERAASDGPEETWFGFHGPAVRVGDLVYLPYSEWGLVILNIQNPQKPELVGQLNMQPPLGSALAAHTVLPLPSRGLAILNDEAIEEECSESVNYAGFVDITDPSKPTLKSLFPTPVPPAEFGYQSFCDAGGRFGPHNQHMPTADPNVFRSDELCFLTYFCAGLRVFDIRNFRRVEEVAYLIPRAPEQRRGPKPTKLVTQVEDVLVDARGYVYFTEKNTGLYVAQWKGFGLTSHP
jgi:hypothetical protein